MGIADERTKAELGFSFVMNSLTLRTPFGRARAAANRPFLPGAEAALEKELDRVEALMSALRGRGRETGAIAALFREMKDISAVVAEDGPEILSVAELFEVKNFLIQLEKLAGICRGAGSALPEAFVPESMGTLLDLLDPEGWRLAAFYIYDSFSEKLAALRRKKKSLRLALQKLQKLEKDRLKERCGISLTQKLEHTVARTDKEGLDRAERTRELHVSYEDYTSVTFTLRGNDETAGLQREAEDLQELIEAEETAVQKALTEKIREESAVFARNMRRIGELDFTLAKAGYAAENGCTRPKILRGHVMRIKGGRYLPLEKVLRGSGKAYRPIDLRLAGGVTCVTGANMGGKTVAIKLAGLTALLAQHGFFAPCVTAELGLSSSVHLLIGDSQDMRKGLSSFGGEIEGLRNILRNSGERALILIDEIAGSTNPAEGYALTKSLVRYLAKRPYIAVLTTHFDNAAEGERVVNLRVRGLAGADFVQLAEELESAGDGLRADVVAKYMDYRLEPAEGCGESPRDALNIARILGLEKDIIEGAEKILKQ
ncbi:MAG: hypothetical protein LBT34_02945 [Clostridiales Family XIII bacterium]|jgi:DNA mismatch repair ATPase MutS|nr:hypothetical protein [Clostridiales Family XIII bacterium]